MRRTDNFQPNWVSPPGKTIEEILEVRGLSLDAFAIKMNKSADYVINLINGYIEISIEIAKELELILGASSTFWINRDIQYRETLTRIKNEEEKEWLKEMPVNDMIRFGWMNDSRDRLAACLKYFNVSDISQWREKYHETFHSVAFRTSASFKSIHGAVAAWLRQGEIQSEKINCNKIRKSQVL